MATLRDALECRLALVLIDNYKNPRLAELGTSGFDTRVVAAPPSTATAVMLNQDSLSRSRWIDDCVACFEQEPQLGTLSTISRTYNWQGWDPAFLTCANDGNGFDLQCTDRR